MLDMQVFREEVEKIRADHDRRGLSHDSIDKVLALDSEWKLMLRETNELRRQKNEAARGIGAAKKSGDEAEAQRILSEVADLGAQISEMEKKTDALLSERDSVRMSIPNLLHPDVPSGADESGNTKHSLHGEKPSFDFEPKTHNELIEENKWVDLERAAKITGSRFYFLKGDLARLEMALQSYAVDFIQQRGFTFVQPPVMMNRAAYEGVTDLSDFEKTTDL